MKYLSVAALLILTASPAMAAPQRLVLTNDRPAPVDRIYPEMEVEGDGWRGLLRVMLLNVDAAAKPQSADSGPIDGVQAK